MVPNRVTYEPRNANGTQAACKVLPGGRGAIRQAALWTALAKRGELIGPYDMLVAATALANGFALATLNRREFVRVPGLSLVETDPYRLA